MRRFFQTHSSTPIEPVKTAVIVALATNLGLGELDFNIFYVLEMNEMWSKDQQSLQMW